MLEPLRVKKEAPHDIIITDRIIPVFSLGVLGATGVVRRMISTDRDIRSAFYTPSITLLELDIHKTNPAVSSRYYSAMFSVGFYVLEISFTLQPRPVRHVKRKTSLSTKWVA